MNISLDKDDFQLLVSGKIVEKMTINGDYVNIALKDIGYKEILKVVKEEMKK